MKNRSRSEIVRTILEAANAIEGTSRTIISRSNFVYEIPYGIMVLSLYIRTLICA
jgi:predicted transcriptional regulator